MGKKLKKLEGVNVKLNSTDQNTLERIKNIFLEPKGLKKQFLEAKPDKQRNLLFEILWNAQIANKKIVNISFKEPYNALAKLENKDDFNSLRCILKIARTEFARRASRGSGREGKKFGLLRREH